MSHVASVKRFQKYPGSPGGEIIGKNGFPKEKKPASSNPSYILNGRQTISWNMFWAVL